MRKNVSAIVAFLMVLAMPASADWQRVLDGTGSTVSPLAVYNRQTAVYFHIANPSTTDSSWLDIRDGYLADICLDDDVDTQAHGSNSTAVEILHSPETSFQATPTLVLSMVLLGVSLNGVAATTGTTNDCIYDVAGPRWILVNPTVTPAVGDALVSVITRRAQR